MCLLWRGLKARMKDAAPLLRRNQIYNSSAEVRTGAHKDRGNSERRC